jgi:hypothetical protein
MLFHKIYTNGRRTRYTTVSQGFKKNHFNAGEKTATVYTRDKAVMRKLDTLVIEFLNVYKLINETEYDRTYEMPKSYANYRKPRHLTDEQRENARKRIRRFNGIQ